MIRRAALWFGTVLAVLVGGYLAAFGRDVLADPLTAAMLSGLAVAAGLSIAGGLRESITIGSATLPWHVLVGAADVLVATVVVLSSVRTVGTAGPTARVVDGALIVGGASLAWLGLQIARDSRHVDLEAATSQS